MNKYRIGPNTWNTPNRTLCLTCCRDLRQVHSKNLGTSIQGVCEKDNCIRGYLNVGSV